MAVGPRPATGLRQLHIEAPRRNTGGHLAQYSPDWIGLQLDDVMLYHGWSF